MTRLGIIGCGDIIHSYNGFATPALKAKGLEVRALIDSNTDNAKQFAGKFPKALIATELTPEVLANTDAFLIAAPNFLHHKYGKECLLAGKHVLMEKPLALTEMECRELIAISQKHELTLMVALCIQYKSQPLTNGLTALESMKIIWRLYQKQF